VTGKSGSRSGPGGSPPSSSLSEFDNAETTEIRRGQELSDLYEETGEIPAQDDASNDPPFARDDIEFDIGDKLADRYRLVEHVHSGGMAHVYRAVDERLHNSDDPRAHVAVKVLRGRLAERADIRDAFEREAASLRSLAHPNIINVFDFDEDGSRCFLVMEWLDGESVQNLLRRSRDNRIDRDLAWRIVDAAARALQHAHDHGVVHADINPANLFITWSGEIKLIDFGIARLDAESAAASGDAVWATRGYASPDVLSGSAARIKDDVYSLACTSYRLLGGAHPFDGMPADKARDLGLTAAPIADLAPADWQLISRALSFDRAIRPHSVNSFIRKTGVIAADAPAPADEARSAGHDVSATPPVWVWASAAAVVAAVLLWTLWPDDATAPPQAVDAPNPSAAASGAEPVSEPAESLTAAEAARPAADAGPAPAVAGVSEDPDAVAGTGLRQSGAIATRPAATPAPREDATTTADARPDAAVAGRSDADGDLGEPGLPEPSTATEAAATPAEPRPTGSEAANPGRASRPGDGAAVSAGLAAAAVTVAETPAQAVPLQEAEPLAAADENTIGVAAADEAPPASASVPPSAQDAAAAGSGATTGQQAAQDLSPDGPAPVVANEDSAAPAPEPTADAPTLIDSPDDAPASEQRLVGEATDEAIPQEVGQTPDGIAEPATAQVAAAAPMESGLKVEPSAQERKITPIEELDLRRYVAPRFPRIARYRDQTGYVELRFTVQPDGSTDNFEVIESVPGDVFVSSAEAAVSRWRFARRDDEVTAQIRLSFDFEE
jgi:TonB family protein